MGIFTAKRAAARLLGKALPLNTGFSKLRRRYVLAYHRVVPHEFAVKNALQDAVWTSVDTFEDDLRWFKRHGDIVSLGELLDFQTKSNRPMFSITFDDGWRDNYEYALPILKKHDTTATVFLITHAIESGCMPWVEDLLHKLASKLRQGDTRVTGAALARFASGIGLPALHDLASAQQLGEDVAEALKEYPAPKRAATLATLYEQLDLAPQPLLGHMLTWEQIRQMREVGIAFGSHTHTHEILQYADDATVREELTASAEVLRKELREPARYFCYPNARYRPDNAEAIEQCGYEYAFRIHNLPVSSHCDCYFIPRFLMNESVSANKSYLLCRLMNLPGF